MDAMCADHADIRDNEQSGRFKLSRSPPVGWVLLLLFLLAPVLLGIAFRVRTNMRAAQLEAAYREAGYATTLDDWLLLYPEPAGLNAADVLDQAAEHILDSDEHVARVPLFDSDVDSPDMPGRFTDEQFARIREFTQLNAVAIDSFEEAGRIGEARYDFEYGTILANLRHVGELRRGGRFLSLRAIRAAREGDADAATDAIIATIGLAETLEHEPLIISWLVRMSLINQAFEALNSTMNITRMDAANIWRVADALTSQTDRGAFERAIEGELAAILLMLKDPTVRVQLNAVDSPQGVALQWLGGPAFEQAAMIEFSHAYLDTVKHAPTDELVDQLTDLESRMQRDLRHHPYVQTLVPAISKTAGHVAFPATCAELARTAAALEAFYRDRFGEEQRFPAGLAELVPEYLDSLPMDPYAGQPLRYSRLDEGYRLYSIGRNRVDDGGLPWGESTSRLQTDDIRLHVSMP